MANMTAKAEQAQRHVTCHLQVKTPKSVKYMTQLSKHFAHKIDVELQEFTSRAVFPTGACLMLAYQETLSLYCRADQEAGLARIQLILEDHLRRFAWREELAFNWQDGLPADPPLDRLPALKDFIDDT